jgi:hypothetical protein
MLQNYHNIILFYEQFFEREKVGPKCLRPKWFRLELSQNKQDDVSNKTMEIPLS